MNRKVLAEKLWEVIANAYAQGGRTRVDLPADEVVGVLLAVMGGVVAGMPDARARSRILSDMAPRVAHAVERIRARPNLHIASRNAALVI